MYNYFLNTQRKQDNSEWQSLYSQLTVCIATNCTRVSPGNLAQQGSPTLGTKGEAFATQCCFNSAPSSISR